NHRVSLAYQLAEALLPFLTTGDALTVDEALKAISLKRRIKLVGEVQVVAAIGDEDAKLAPVGRVGAARLLRSYITGFRRSGTGCVTGDICHSTAPILALNIRVQTH